MTRTSSTGATRTKRSWLIDPKTKKLKCYPHDNDDCAVIGLWEAGESDLHDAPLQAATAQINRILDRVVRDNEDTSRHLSMISFDGRWMLAWVEHGEGVTSSSADPEIARALKVKRVRQA